MKDRFHDAGLFEQALVHRSWAHENGGEHNERLEFLGDAVLQVHATELLYQAFPDLGEGELSRIRSKLVNTDTLAALAKDRGLDALVKLGVGEESSGGRARSRLLAGLYEAVLGALFLDQGLGAAREVVRSDLEPRLKRARHARSPKQVLQEWCQRTHGTTPVYEVLETSGPPHDRVFRVAVLAAGTAVGEGSGPSKRLASVEAAGAAVRGLGLGDAG